jgi:hypothetical protein
VQDPGWVSGAAERNVSWRGCWVLVRAAASCEAVGNRRAEEFLMA